MSDSGKESGKSQRGFYLEILDLKLREVRSEFNRKLDASFSKAKIATGKDGPGGSHQPSGQSSITALGGEKAVLGSLARLSAFSQVVSQAEEERFQRLQDDFSKVIIGATDGLAAVRLLREVPDATSQTALEKPETMMKHLRAVREDLNEKFGQVASAVEKTGIFDAAGAPKNWLALTVDAVGGHSAILDSLVTVVMFCTLAESSSTKEGAQLHDSLKRATDAFTEALAILRASSYE